MLRFELDKLFIKQKALVLLIVVFVITVFTVVYNYPKNTFSSSETERQFYEYTKELSGKLTEEKKEKILAEQLVIIEAQNDESIVSSKLRNGGYENREEYRAELSKTLAVTNRAEPFNELFTRYSHAVADPERRYILSGNYDGMTVDFADLPFILLIVFSTAMLFLTEENSKMITFMRISENGQGRTFRAKIVSLALLIVAGSVFGTAAEFVMLNVRGSFEELSYPIQSIVYFDGCPFDLTILEGFLVLNLIKLMGYFFVSAFVILLSITLKKALLTVFIPFALCVLQQFAFTPATPAYYLPTGLLRAVGYFRGAYQTETYPIETIEPVPPQTVFIVSGAALVFIAVSIFTAYKYYCPRGKKFNSKAAVSVISAALVCLTLTGCGEERRGAPMNWRETSYFSQSDDYIFFLNEGGEITAERKSDGEKISLMHDPFAEKSVFGAIYSSDNTLYYLKSGFSSELISLNADTFEERLVYSPLADEGTILGLGYGFKRERLSVEAAFSNGTDWFLKSSEGGIFRLKNGSLENILSDKEVTSKLCFDGRRIFYITQALELMSYDTVSSEENQISDDFVGAVYTDGERVVYSTEQGIFSLYPENNTEEKLSDETADELACADGRTVYCKDETLYLLDDEPVEIYSGMQFGFAVISGKNKVWVRAYDTQTNQTNDLFLDLP